MRTTARVGRAVIVLWCIAGLVPAEIIDRIAISCGNQVITEGQIDEEVRLTEFLNQEKLDLSAAERKKAADRLIEQALIRRDIQFSHYPTPSTEEGDDALKALIARYPKPSEYQQALQGYGVDEAALRRRLLWQLTVLRFVDYRFRPGIQVPDADVQAYYAQQVVKWKETGVNPIPTLEDSRDGIEQVLTEQRVDQALDTWITETRSQVAIQFHDETLR